MSIGTRPHFNPSTVSSNRVFFYSRLRISFFSCWVVEGELAVESNLASSDSILYSYYWMRCFTCSSFWASISFSLITNLYSSSKVFSKIEIFSRRLSFSVACFSRYRDCYFSNSCIRFCSIWFCFDRVAYLPDSYWYYLVFYSYWYLTWYTESDESLIWVDSLAAGLMLYSCISDEISWLIVLLFE
jgi:hypothetical protein